MNPWNSKAKKARVAILAGLLLLVCIGVAFADGLEEARRRGKLLVGVKTDFPPFGYLDGSGTIQGFDADLARHLGKTLFEDPPGVELVPVTSGGRIPFLYSGWIDIILLVPKESPIQGLQDLAGRTVAVLAGSVQERDLAQIAPDARRAAFERLPEAVAALRQKRADALAQDDLFVLAAAKADPDLRAAGHSFLPRPYVIAVRKGETRFIAWVNGECATGADEIRRHLPAPVAEAFRRVRGRPRQTLNPTSRWAIRFRDEEEKSV